MAYSINRWSGPVVATVQDGSVSESLDIKLIGKNFAGYGEIQNENMVFMLENFAGPTPPSKAIAGQLWYDTNSKKLKIFSGEITSTGIKVWKSNTGAEYRSTPPLTSSPGDMWFDTVKSQLKVKTTSDWLAIGPQSTGTRVTQMVSRVVKGRSRDASPTSEPTQFSIIAATIDDVVLYVISKSEFTLDTNDELSRITGFATIKEGMTCTNTFSTGITSTGHIFWGTVSYALSALNATKLDGLASSEYVKKTEADFTQLASFSDSGLVVGNEADLKLLVENGDQPFIESSYGRPITFRFKPTIGGVTTTRLPLIINSDNVLPGANSVINLGTPLYKWSSVYADRFEGVADSSDRLKLDTNVYATGSVSASVGSIAVRDGFGNLTANRFIGTVDNASFLQVGDDIFRSASTEATVDTVAVRDGAGAIKATSFTGLASTASALRVGSQDRTPSVDASNNTIVVRAADGTIKANRFEGVADSAEFLNVNGTDVSASATTAGTIVLRDSFGNFAAGTITATLSGNASTATRASNITGGSTGQLVYQTGVNASSFITPGTSGHFLVSQGPGAVPNWSTIPVATDSTAGTVKPGFGMSVTGDGTMSIAGMDTDGNLTVTGSVSAATATGAFTNQDITTASYFSSILQSGSSFAPLSKIRSTGPARIRTLSFGVLHNPDNTIDGVVHGIDTGDANNHTWLFKQNGDFTAPGNLLSTSDERLKSNISTITNALELVNQLRGVTYDKDGRSQIGLIAQEVLKVLPQVVEADSNGFLSVAYGNLVGLLVEAINNLTKEVDELKKKVN